MSSAEDAASTSAPSSNGASSAAAASSSSSSSAAPAAPAAAASIAVTPASVLESLKGFKEWQRAVVFDSESRVIAATFKVVDSEVDAWLRLLDKRDDTIASGIILLNEQYDVHRFHPPLAYGRRGDPTSDDSEGICVCRVARKAAGRPPVFALITYTYPTLSARAAPQLKEFCETQLVHLA